MRYALVWMILLGACKGDAVQCEKGCRNYAALAYWKNAELDIAKFPPAERDARRKWHVSKFTSELEGGVDVCVSQCQSANNPDDINCMVKAKTADQATGCLK